MRFLQSAIILLAFSPLILSLRKHSPDNIHFCEDTEREGEVCPEYYAPTIGFYFNGERKIYGNRCEACHDKEVTFYVVMETCPDPLAELPCRPERVCVPVGSDELIAYESDCAACSEPGVTSFFRNFC